MNGSGPAELDALRLSLEVAARSVGFSLPLAVLVAWILTRARFPGRMLFDAFVHLPLVLPPVAVGYVLLILFGVRGPIGGWLRAHFGIELAFTTAGAALATAVMTFPLLVRAIRLSLENVDRGLEEAARTLGASALDRFVSITLPLMLPGILAGAVTAFRSEEHTSELQSLRHLVCRLLLEKKNKIEIYGKREAPTNRPARG